MSPPGFVLGSRLANDPPPSHNHPLRGIVGWVVVVGECLFVGYLSDYQGDIDMTEMKVNESEVKVIEIITKLEKRIISLECKLDALNWRLENGERHPEDFGWFE